MCIAFSNKPHNRIPAFPVDKVALLRSCSRLGSFGVEKITTLQAFVWNKGHDVGGGVETEKMRLKLSHVMQMVQAARFSNWIMLSAPECVYL